MPTYAYRCSACGHQFDQFQRFSEDPLSICPECQGSIRRVVQPVGVVFKGSGWYITDSRKPTSDNGGSEKSEKSEKADKTDKADKPEKAGSGDKVAAEGKTGKSATPAAEKTSSTPAAAASD